MKYVKLSQIAKFINGYAFKPSDWARNGTRIIRIQNLKNNSKPFNRTKKNLSSKYWVNRGDILVSWSATIGVFEWDIDELGYLNQHIFKVVIDELKIDKIYFKFVLKQTIHELSQFAHGFTMKHILKQDFERHKIPLPSLDTQKRIAKVLMECENLIRERRESIRLLDELVRGTFLEMFGKSKVNTKKWPIKSLEEIAEVTSGVTKGKKYKDKQLIEVPYLRVANAQDGYLDMSEIKTIKVTQKEIDKYKLKKGDLLLTEGGDPDKLGRGAIYWHSTPNCIYQNHLYRVRVKNDAISQRYLSALVSSSYGKGYFLKAAKQTSGIATINSKQLRRFPVIVPPFELQQHFSQIVEEVEKLKATYQESLQELENLYHSLSQGAFRGELDLSKVEINLEDTYPSIGVISPVIHKDEKNSAEALSNELNLDKMEILALIREHFPRGYFTFDDLCIKLDKMGNWEFESVKEELFQLLREQQIKQVFVDAAYQAAHKGEAEVLRGMTERIYFKNVD